MSGRNATNVVNVPAIKGALYSFTANNIAAFLLYPNFNFSLAHSIITITVSIAIHRVNTREKFVKKFNDIHKVSNTKNVIKNANGINKEAIIDSLNQTNNNIVKNTNTRVVIAVFHKLP
jgi:hypothetical protein